ncbi:conserved hypothetical protein [Leishmania infantum JPCM5]|uniref:Eukaryotic_protein_of_uncharacterized_function_(D UF872)_-_putative n=2 Tax=Leishmania infantum TaxID=5671 RepID=A0A6L0XK31_LEIIN|nr:conserved hypothetical protein [Leishmania infantum JPCM5]CAC9515166.1 Eukaryotic_protein_of_uncharacterised_function_(DUF872)_-_putative [Leishmania infantum]CAM70179.1 conserved hypothetical protein [Leishmania infantum JPCM5]SUZ44098.1 Eukaryotic_protein_of_uncharacterised_function_(DUF872)_-_putative [Leishmania infantum]|eukprot:XP_001467126.1 conserved hypothetical protein [Leishmania infantum JPCM5]
MRQRKHAPDASATPVLLDPNVDLSEEWRAMNAEYDGYSSEQPPRTLSEFREQLQQARQARSKRSLESEGEEDAFYRTVDGNPKDYALRVVFEFLCPANPTKARLRVERIYWIAWKQFLYGFFMSGVGTMLMLVGIGCTAQYCVEKARGAGVMLGAFLLCVPGYYSLFVLYMYVTCRGGYTYLQLPEA